MFQFTTTNVINSQKDLTTGLPLWSLQTKEDAEGNEVTTLFLKRIGNFNKDNVVAIYKAPAIPGRKPEAKFNLQSLPVKEDGTMYSLDMWIGLTQGSNFSLYSNDTYYKGKPFTIDFVYNKTVANTAKKLEETIKKLQVDIHGERMVTVEAEGTWIKITGATDYQRFEKVVINRIDPEANHGMGALVPALEAETVFTDSEYEESTEDAVVKQGVESFGTFEFIRNNLRIPTASRSGAFVLNAEENPIPGATYTQYTIHYCKNRGILGNNAVGDLVTSATTHVLYVNDALLEAAPEGPEFEGVTYTTLETALEAIAPNGELKVVTPEYLQDATEEDNDKGDGGDEEQN